MAVPTPSEQAGAPREDLPRFCPACHQPVARFKPGGVRKRPNAKCPSCGALERHRFLGVVLDGLGPVIGHAARVLDIAPSRYTTHQLHQLSPGQYVRVDLDPEADGRAVDVQASLTRLPFAPASFDLVICYHVLEHVPDDAAAMRELARVLRAGGVALVQVPFRPSRSTDEDPDAPEQERIERFGQADHVRWYGIDLEERLAAAGLTGPRITPVDVLGPELCEVFGVREGEAVWVLRAADGHLGPGGGGGVARLEAPANHLLTGIFDLAADARTRSADETARLRDERDRLRAQLVKVRRQRDTWRARHERVTGHPAVRIASAPYRWWRHRWARSR